MVFAWSLQTGYVIEYIHRPVLEKKTDARDIKREGKVVLRKHRVTQSSKMRAFAVVSCAAPFSSVSQHRAVIGAGVV